MNNYIKNWIDIIENMNNDNTYKLAWGRAIIELAIECDETSEVARFTFDMIAQKMIKYYWNQMFFFDLKQSSSSSRPPVLVQNTEKLIQKYKDITKSSSPIWFDKAELVLKQDLNFYDSVLKSSAKKLKDDVSWRFMNIKNSKLPIYKLYKEDLSITLKKQDIISLKDYGFVLSQLLNYKWAQLLEKYNNIPKVASKVKGISASTLRRNSLKKFRDVLFENDAYNPVDFYTGKPLAENDISVDHVLPWSFIYSDDLWNLVLTSKSYNSSKGKTIPSPEIIEKLKKRNIQMITDVRINDTKMIEELKESISCKYVDKYYNALRL